MDSDQKTLNMAVIGADTLARGARTRITSIQGLGIAASTLTLYDSANAAAPGTAVAVYKYGTEGLEVYIPGSGIKFENGIVYNLAGAGGSVTVTITGA
ncbi:hypothetical protein OAP44_01925 [Candidatus Pelagibacter sp.]|jgi:hypothetical protein|nr:hypothetical protein [Candidatus Pelagibacter sp.]|tara:strand:- start:64 stop:357 length:294 start_codon:yes stop_codon:yes gene_type:complete